MGNQPKLAGADLDLQELAMAITTSRGRKISTTMELDKSQPPTPDGSGLPANFQLIAPRLYRSSYPSYPHYQHLADLDLKTIITLVAEPLDTAYSNFLTSNGIIHHQIPILANKVPEICTDPETINQVLSLIFDPSNYPMLIHCNKGKHRTGCIVACFRRVCGWSLEVALEEYVRYSTPKDRPLDKVFIEKYDESFFKATALDRGYVGGVYAPPNSKSSCYTTLTMGEDVSDDDEDGNPNKEYQENARKAHEQLMESFHRWNSHR